MFITCFFKPQLLILSYLSFIESSSSSDEHPSTTFTDGEHKHDTTDGSPNTDKPETDTAGSINTKTDPPLPSQSGNHGYSKIR